MRTSKVSQDTARIFNAISPNTLASSRATRSAKRLASFALGYNGEVQVKEEEQQEDGAATNASSADRASTSAGTTPDIEDAVMTRPATITTRSPPPRGSRKRKLGADGPVATATATATMTTVKREHNGTTPRMVKIEQQKQEYNEPASLLAETALYRSPERSKAKPKIPARRHTSPSGKVTVTPPSNWAEMYEIVQAMRRRNPTAPVDTMGCEDLYWRGAPPREKRYHTLTALMLSSQTKDTVTAAAMQRLHTELVPGSGATDSQSRCGADGIGQSVLTVENVLACPPAHLDSLIGKVGFHNNKTKYIQQTAAILQERFAGDIPDTIEGLVSLPGVGPKMAYLCMSAAWGVDQGIGVDVHVHRITNLWGWHKTKNPEETRLALQAWLPRDKWHEINKLLVGLGQTVCLPVGRRCGECDLAGSGLCKAEVRGWKPSERRVKREKIEVELELGAGILKEEVIESKQLVVKAEE